MRVFKFSSARVRFSLLPRDGVLLSFGCYAARVRLSLLPRDRVVLLFSYCAARVRFFFTHTLSFRAKPRTLVETNAAAWQPLFRTR